MSRIRTMFTSMTGRSTATSSASAGNSGPKIQPSMQSRHFMASDTNSTMSDEEADLALSWSGRWTLGHRILAGNVLRLALLAISVLYLDSYRNRLSKERTRQTRIEATTTAQALAHVSPKDWPALLAAVS